MIGKEILNYVITSFIGQGGMGSVYLAEHKYIKSKKVAIKVINGTMVNAFTKEKLAEEAEHLSTLDHPNIVHFQNYHIDEAGNIYLLMQYADGVSLEKYINTISGLIVEDRICPIFEPILDAVGYAHKHNIMHLDLKPNNIMIGEDGTPRILDFGIAKIIREENGEVRRNDMIMGTPSFMSPEQVKGETLDARSDIYSLGVMLHQMLTGRAPYDTTALSETDINQKVVEEPLPRMKSFYSYISDKVQNVVDKATAKDPKDRYQSCEDFKKALHNAIYPPQMPNWAKYAAAVAGLIVVSMCIYWWDYTRTKVYYYKDYVEQWGVPQGIGEIGSAQRSHMERAYRFEYCRRKLARVSHVNSYDNVDEDGEDIRAERPTDMLLSYAEDGKISSIKVKDQAGKVLYVKSFNSTLSTMTFQYDDENGTEKTLGTQTVGGTNAMDVSEYADKGRISRWLLTYDENGYVTELKYAGFQNVLVGDDDNIYGRRYERDPKGRIVKESYLGKNGESKGTKWGLGVIKFFYNDKDNLVKVEYLTTDEKPAYNKPDGMNIYELGYDEYDNQTFEYYEDANGELMLYKKWQCAGFEHVINEKGLRVKDITLGIDRQPCYGEHGFAIVTNEYDKYGYISAVTCFDLEGNICLNTNGYASLALINDSVGNTLEYWTYDIDGSFIADENNMIGYKAEYDSVGNMTRYIMYGINKEPVIGKYGYCGYERQYNKFGAVKRKTNLGKDMNPIENYSGIMSTTYEYDERGNMTKIAYTDETGNNLKNCNEGYAYYEYTYDENGHTLQLKYYDEKGKPVNSPSGYASWAQTFDEYGNRTSFKYYNKDGKLVLVEGKAGTIYSSDDRGNVIEDYSIGTDGEIIPNSLIGKNKYDERDNQTEFAVFDKNGNRVIGYAGYHKKVSTYNSRNQITEARYYDTSDGLKKCDDGYAIVRYEYDDRGNNTKTSYMGTDEKLAKSKDGYAVAKYEYDNMNRVIKSCFFDVKGLPTEVRDIAPVIVKRYDKWGNITYWASEDGHGSFINNPNWGCAIERLEYDVRGKLLSVAYYNDADQPIVSTDHGFHKRVATYDNRGNYSTVSFFNAEGAPMVNRKSDAGYHKAVYQYNSRNKQTEEAYYDADEQPMINNGYHKEVNTYNDQGKIEEVKYLGKKSEPVNNSYGFHRAVYSYTDSGENDKVICYTTSGRQYCSYKWDGEQYQLVKTWQSIVQNQSTPIYTGENWGYLVLKDMYVNGSRSFKMVIATPKSKYEMNDDTLKIYKDLAVQMAKVFTQDDTLRRSSIYCDLVLYDSSDRLLFQTTVY